MVSGKTMITKGNLVLINLKHLHFYELNEMETILNTVTK